MDTLSLVVLRILDVDPPVTSSMSQVQLYSDGLPGSQTHYRCDFNDSFLIKQQFEREERV
jgi:hypothetical protein